MDKTYSGWQSTVRKYSPYLIFDSLEKIQTNLCFDPDLQYSVNNKFLKGAQICLLIFAFDYQSKLNFVFKYQIFPKQSTRHFGLHVLQASLRAHDVGIPFPTLDGENPLEASCASTLITFNTSQGYHAYGNIVQQ